MLPSAEIFLYCNLLSKSYSSGLDTDQVPGNGLMGVLARPGVRGSPPLLPGGIAADGRSRERVTV